MPIREILISRRDTDSWPIHTFKNIRPLYLVLSCIQLGSGGRQRGWEFRCHSTHRVSREGGGCPHTPDREILLGMGFPAARVGDMHMCPMVTPGVPPIPHVGGPILPPCAVNTLIGMIPAARVTDMAVCVGPPDTIVKGSATVLINKLPAARVLDNCMHGGMIVLGDPTVLIGG